MYKLNRFILKQNSLFTILEKYSTKAKTKAKENAAEKALLSRNFPDNLLSKKHKTPSHMYIANEEAADAIYQHIEPYLKQAKCDTILEMNPGTGLLTRKLLDNMEEHKKLILIESHEHFMPHLRELQAWHSERVSLKQADIVSLWKVAYQDKLDNGTRVNELLEDVPRSEHVEDPNMCVIGAVGTFNFFKHLINSLIFQNSLLSLGRCEMYLVMPPPIYIHLTCNNEIGYMIYRSTSMLFQILFEYRFIAQLPREHFLPAQIKLKLQKCSKLTRLKSINPENLYLVKIVPRREVMDLCAAEDLTALWYFVKQNCVSRRNRIVPNIEKTIPGCGPRLIINRQHTEEVNQLYPDEDIGKLPKYSTPCTTMNTSNFYPNLTIYTQFGDLNGSQMLTLFTQFRHWPEYAQSSFLASLENSLLKMELSVDENLDGIDIKEEDDIASDMASLEDETLVDEKEESNKPKKRKTTTRKKAKAKDIDDKSVD